MFTVITSQLKSKPVTYDWLETMQLIAGTNPYMSADYHLLREITKIIDSEDYKDAEADTKKVIKLHNSIVKPTDTFVFLGDISEKEICKPEDIAKLYNLIKSLNGIKIMVRGNNENLDDAFYNKCGFRFVRTGYLATKDIILSHEPINLHGLKCNSDVINIHGHLHGYTDYRNIDWHNHIDVYWKKHNGPKRLSQYIKEFRNGDYGVGTTVTTPFYDQNQV